MAPNPPSYAHATGGIFNTPRHAIVGDAGPEALLPLDTHGAHFLAGMVMQVTKQMAMQSSLIPTVPSYKGGTTQIDASTNFTGPVTVEASDPAEMARKLKEQARIKKLTRPSLVSS